MSSPVDFALHMIIMHDVMSFCMLVVYVSKQLFLGTMIVLHICPVFHFAWFIICRAVYTVFALYFAFE